MFSVFSNHKLSLGAKTSSCQLVKNLVGTFALSDSGQLTTPAIGDMNGVWLLAGIKPVSPSDSYISILSWTVRPTPAIIWFLS